MTRRSRLLEHRRLASRIITTDLSPTFRDAIACTLSLGLDDLWIDSLCIIQDSVVYKYAWGNIAATEAHMSGLFTDHKQSQVEVMLPKVI